MIIKKKINENKNSWLRNICCCCCRVARSYRTCYIETSGGIHNLYASKIFCGWDFGVASYKAASLCSASIYRELKELLAEADSRSRPQFLKRLGMFLYQCGMTILVLTVMAAMGVLLWVLLEKHEAHESNPWSLLLVPFVITCIMNVFPAVISLLVSNTLMYIPRKKACIEMYWIILCIRRWRENYWIFLDSFLLPYWESYVFVKKNSRY